MNVSLTKRYEDRVVGVLSCYDRVVITGTLPGACYAAGMTSFLNANDIRIFDDPRFAEPLRERIRARARKLASAAGLTIEHIAKAHTSRIFPRPASPVICDDCGHFIGLKKSATPTGTTSRASDATPSPLAVVSRNRPSSRPWHDHFCSDFVKSEVIRD